MWSLPILTLLFTLASPSYAASLSASTGVTSNTTQRRDSTTYVQVAYFTNWGIYGLNFQPTDIDPSQLTHILYAFADVSPSTGKIFLTDSWADVQKHYPGDSWDEPGNNLYGCLKQLYLLKLSHRHLKVLLSVGGWTYSQDGHFAFLTDSDLRRNFVSSAVDLVKDYGFDGIDIDFEYPANEAQGQGLVDLMTSLRQAFDELAIANGDTSAYELTAAVAAGPQHYGFYPIEQLDRVLTYWNLMAYDYAGPWLTLAENQANLYGGSGTGINTDAAIKHYISSGATPGKIALGIPLYGRAFENTAGIGKPYEGVGPGTISAGIYSYKDLPLPGAEVHNDLVDVASYSYDSVKRELVSYDDPVVVRIKAEYVQSRWLAGCMFWDLSTDRTGSESLVQTAGATLGQLDQTPNHIHFPHSKWDNIRNNMVQVSSTPVPSTTRATTARTTSTSTSARFTTTRHTSTSTTTTTTHTLTPSTSPNSCLCSDVSSWDTETVYVGGDEVVYDGSLWTAKWWTLQNVPGGSANVWQDEGACDAI